MLNQLNRSIVIMLTFVYCLVVVGCGSGGNSDGEGLELAATAESCMSCHNGSNHNDYAGSGLENPHPFPGAATLTCTECHGGDGTAASMLASHIPPPPEIGDRAFQEDNREAYFNRLTQTGLDKYDDYIVDGVTYTALDFLQFINPGDLRVVTQGKSCGSCHQSHADCVAKSLLATEAGVLSGGLYAMGVDNLVPASQGLYQDTAADVGFRAILDPNWIFNAANVGSVSELIEYPVRSVRGVVGIDELFNNQIFTSAGLADDIGADGRVISGSPLAILYSEQIAFTCGDCHLGSAGANNRYGDFRSSGCTACHMSYSLDGRYTGTDPNINRLEPADPDDIDEPERPHVRSHTIQSVAKTLPNGLTQKGIDDHTCAGCHQGSNRTVMQYWGIRLDQNQDVRRGHQYPANPVSFVDTRDDTRLFDPVVDNNTFNGRNFRQYLAFEDYDGDGRDDTPPDVHHDAGMGCIDCHGSHDLHGGNVSDPDNLQIVSRMEQAVAITCESCHGTLDAYAPVATGTKYSGVQGQLAMDREGNALRHVERESNGDYILTSRLTGDRHYVSQVRDLVVDTGKINPVTKLPVYSSKASYAMGRADGLSATGLGPLQTGSAANGFCHSDNMSCASCHSSWTNSCNGCHLVGEYNNGNNFSNITGERIVFRERDAQFIYQSPVPFQLGIDTHGKISATSPNTKAFFSYRDLNGDFSQIFTFSDRNAQGANPGTAAHPALGHNAMMAHSIRGKVDDDNEGTRYCTACHLTTEGLANFGTEYDDFRTAMAAGNYAALDYNLLQQHIGQNPSNQLNSPIWVHMVAGLGSGLFTFDEDGCAVNPLDDNEDRFGCNDVAPADVYDAARIVFDLDRIVDATGREAASNSHPFLDPAVGPALRDGATNPNMSGPMGATLIRTLTDPVLGVVLDSWLDANGAPQGDANNFLFP